MKNAFVHSSTFRTKSDTDHILVEKDAFVLRTF